MSAVDFKAEAELLQSVIDQLDAVGVDQGRAGALQSPLKMLAQVARSGPGRSRVLAAMVLLQAAGRAIYPGSVSILTGLQIPTAARHLRQLAHTCDGVTATKSTAIDRLLNSDVFEIVEVDQ